MGLRSASRAGNAVGMPITPPAGVPNSSLAAHSHAARPLLPCRTAAPASVPADFDAELGKYTREGLRVLGLATRQLAGLSEGEVQGMAQVRPRAGQLQWGVLLLTHSRESAGTTAGNA